MWIYLGMFLIAFATLVVEITLTRLLSVITWYHLAFFAIATAMLGMTAGATRIYLNPDYFRKERLPELAARACLHFSFVMPISLILLCLIPMGLHRNTMYLMGVFVSTVACSLPFYFSGTAISLLLTKHSLPIGKLYASDLAGASAGCLFVVFGLRWFDAPSLLLLAGALGALSGSCILGQGAPNGMRRCANRAFIALVLLALVNTSSFGIRPLVVKEMLVGAPSFYEKWNSFSRVVVENPVTSGPQLWGPSPRTPRDIRVLQYPMNIDGEASTYLRQFRNAADIEHLRYDITSLAYYLRPVGKACVIGVGGGRDVQTALLFGHRDILAVEFNPIFVDLLKNRFRDFAGVATHPGVRLVTDEARSYLTRTNERFSLLQMSLVDTWAATGAGAFSLSENSLYTVEAWKLFLNRLEGDGVFTVTRWHDEANLGETGRIISLAVAALFEIGARAPEQHIALVSAKNTSTLMICRKPFEQADLRKVRETCADLAFDPVVLPGSPSANEVLGRILSARSIGELSRIASAFPLNYQPTTDENPYFFNMLRPRMLGSRELLDLATPTDGVPRGVVKGNLVATITLIALLLVLSLLAVVTIMVPLWIHRRKHRRASLPKGFLGAGGLYFSLIGAGFMLVEIALIQKLSVYLGHPVYALSVLLFTLIASTGFGSYVSERLPLTRQPWLYLCPIGAALSILATNLLVGKLVALTIALDPSVKIALSVMAIAPVGFLLGFFFPTGMRLFKRFSEENMPWLWALNGVFGVLCSALAVFISIFFGITVNFYIAGCCYAAILGALALLRGQSQMAESGR